MTESSIDTLRGIALATSAITEPPRDRGGDSEHRRFTAGSADVHGLAVGRLTEEGAFDVDDR